MQQHYSIAHLKILFPQEGENHQGVLLQEEILVPQQEEILAPQQEEILGLQQVEDSLHPQQEDKPHQQEVGSPQEAGKLHQEGQQGDSQSLGGSPRTTVKHDL